MIHRHYEVPQDLPVEELPAVAIADLLERGDLQDWQPLAGAIRRDPWGRLATSVARLLDAYPRYGTSPLWRAWIDRCRASTPEASRATPEAVAAAPVTLAALRRDLGLTQAQVARRLRMTQSDVSKLERREDVRLSTLLAYARALGGRVRVTFDDGEATREIQLKPRPDGSR
ncbi:MAG: helix-turn-helix transcriptional regulator [Spirochaetaceae bacterium]|nr:helix-turn-helix transcriptional regulator [Spirochaetaceae bacterium]